MFSAAVLESSKSEWLKSASCAAVMLSMAAGGTTLAQAQVAEAATTDAVEELAEVVVTGSRIARSGFTANTPTTVLGSETLANQGLTNIAQLLNQVPAFRGSATPGSATFAFTSVGGNFVNLRALGPNRTLVLVDSARVVPSTSVGTFDLNLIPSIMIDRTEIVTGGASAAYGSDAVSGVVNLLLKRKFNGIHAEAQAGMSQYGDASESRLAIIAGSDFAGGRGHALIGGEFVDNKGIRSLVNRDWAHRQTHVFVGSGGVRYVADNNQTANMTYGGLIVSGPLRGTAFGTGGTTSALVYGNQFGNAVSTVMSGGSNPDTFNYVQNDMLMPVERYSVLGRVGLELSDNVSGFVTGNFAHSGGSHPSVTSRDTGLSMRVDNAYLPASVRAAMVTNNLATISVGRINRDLGVFESSGSNETWRVGAGVEGNFGGGWKWDTYVGYGANSLDSDLSNLRINSRFTQAIDAVFNPATGGIVCRSTLTTPGNGCIPFNVFGENSNTTNAATWINGTSSLRQRTTQIDVVANIQGAPFATWAGDVNVAAGIEYRNDGIKATVDALSLANSFNVSNPKSIPSSSIIVREGYVETVVPLLREKPLFQLVELNGAVRRADYSLAGPVTTWKAGLVWQVSDDVRFRGTRSRDIRAPNLSETFTGQQTGGPLLNWLGVAQLTPTITSGNRSLTPEIANTHSYGIGLSPSRIPGLRLNIDYYDISIGNAISVVPAQTLLDGCASGIQAYCARITLVNNRPTLVNFSPFNIARFKTSGVDFELGYGFRAGPGRMDISALANYVDKLIAIDASGTRDRAGQIGGGLFLGGADGPHWTADANVHYAVGRAGMNLHARYVGSGKLDNYLTAAQLNTNILKSRLYFDLAADYAFPLGGNDRKVQLFGAVNNVLNLAPPPTLPLSSLVGGTSSTFYDTVGRSFTLGVRVRY